MVEEGKAIVIPEPRSIITLDENHAAIVIHNVETLTKSFKIWLQEEVDYTRTLFGHSGKPTLLDPGAQKIRSFFQAYPETHIIEHLEDTTPGSERVKYVVRADITHVSGIRIGSGVGSCTTDESKYKYRWLTESKLREQDYTTEQIQNLPSRETKTQRGGHFTVYRVRNPELLDLDNTILKMASKRAEVDATLSLPGVSGVFTQDIDQYPDAVIAEEEAQTSKKLDPDEEQVKAILTANGVRIDDLNIYKYGTVVMVVPRPEFPQELFEDYNESILNLLKSKWVAKKERWEISC